MFKHTSLLFVCLFFACNRASDLAPTSDQKSFEVSPYGVDGLNQRYLDQIAMLGDGSSGINGISWETLEPEPPQNGNHTYMLTSELMALRNALQATDRGLQLNLRLASHWALERDPAVQVTNPETGLPEDGIVAVRTVHEEDLRALVRYILDHIEVEALQVGSEAENEWLDANAYVHALSIIYETAKELQPDIIIMAFGFNPANYFTQPELFDPTSINSKLNFVQTVLANGEPYFDAFSFHASREYEAILPTVSWIKDQMRSNGYEKPIWIDDMYSAQWLNPNSGTPEEIELYAALLNEEPEAIDQFDSLQASYMIKKITTAFVAGVQKLYVSSDVNWDFYYIPNWRFVGLINSFGESKPSYHNLQLLIEKTGAFESVLDLGNNLYEFTFSNRSSLYIYWNESTEGAVPALPDSESYVIHTLAYQMGDVPVATTLSGLGSYPFDGNPVLIELN